MKPLWFVLLTLVLTTSMKEFNTPMVSALSLTGFDLDMYSGLLSLVFDAAVQSGTLNVSAVQLQSNLTSAEERYRLTDVTEGVFPASNTSKTVLLAMAERDVLSILFLQRLAISAENTWLTLQPGCVRAFPGNAK